MAKFEIITYIFQSCFLWAGLIITVFNLLLLLSFYAWKLKFFFLWFSLMTTQSQVWTCSPLYSWKKYKENWKQPSLTLCLREWEYSESPETSLTQGTSATSVFFVGGGGLTGLSNYRNLQPPKNPTAAPVPGLPHSFPGLHETATQPIIIHK